jgi:hypothetical protein
MADRIETTKLVGYASTGKDNVASVSKLVAYLILEPSDAPDDSNRQGHVYSQIIRKV